MASAFPPSEADMPSDGRILLNASLLKNLRQGRALSQEALANLCFSRQLCVSIASIKRAETGKFVLYRTARHLATVFEIEPERLRAAPAHLARAAPQATAGPGTAAVALPHDVSARYVIELDGQLASPTSRNSADLALLVGQFGGRMASHAEGRFSAVFGLPRAYLSDAERAMRCALELARRSELALTGAVALQLARWDDPMGRAADASRPPPPSVHGPEAAIWVERALALQVRDTFVFTQEHSRYQRLAALADSQANAGGPMFGRYAELRQFKGVIETLHEFQSGHVIYVRGTGGVGKTRLLHEFADVGRQAGIACHHCAVPDFSLHSGSAALTALTRSLFGAPGHGSAPIDATLARLQLPAASSLFHRLLSATPMDADELAVAAAMTLPMRESGMLGALQELIVRLSIRTPLLITVEDIHWGDDALFAALGALITHTRHAPVLWVLSSRTESDPIETALRPYLSELPLSIFELGPLSEREAKVLAAQFPAVEMSHQHQCVERACGNPLFLTQLLASPAHLFPDSLKHLIQIRMDALSAEHRHALRMATVIGASFALDLLRAALCQPSYVPESAGQHGLVRRCGAHGYAFVHDLVMHCIYDAIEPAQRRVLHRTVAELYRGHDPALLAHHLWCADDPSAFEMALAALREHLTARRFGAALELSTRWLPTRPAHLALALLHAEALSGAARLTEARLAYRRALDLATSAPDRILVAVGLAGVLNILEMLDEEQHLLETILPQALALNSDIALAQLLHLQGNIYFPRGNYNACRHYQEQSVYHARAGNSVETEICALSGMGDSYYAEGDMSNARAMYRQCLNIASDQRLLQYDAPNRSALASTLHYLGLPEHAHAGAREAATLAKRLGNGRAEILARMTAGWVLLGCGKFSEAKEEVAAGIEVSRSIGAARFEPLLMESMARVSWSQGNTALARQQIAWAADQIAPLQLQGFIGAWLMGTLALFSDKPTVRRKALRQGETFLAHDCLAHNSYRFRVAAAEVALLAGDLRAAQLHASRLGDRADGDSCAWLRHHVNMVQAYTQWVLAPGEQARMQVRQLRQDAAQFGFTHTMPRLHAVMAGI